MRAAREISDKAEFDRTRGELSELKVALDMRERELTDARRDTAKAAKQIDEARERWRQDADAAMAQAETIWRGRRGHSAFTGRVPMARAIRARAGGSDHAAGSSRSGAREPFVAPVRETGGSNELGRLRDELVAAQATLADQETKLATSAIRRQTRARTMESAGTSHASKNRGSMGSGRSVSSQIGARTMGERGAHRQGDATRGEEERKPASHLIRDGAIAASLAVAAMFFLYPTVEPALVEAWSAIAPPTPEAVTRIGAPPAQPFRPQPALPRDVISVHLAKVHAAPRRLRRSSPRWHGAQRLRQSSSRADGSEFERPEKTATPRSRAGCPADRCRTRPVADPR